MNSGRIGHNINVNIVNRLNWTRLKWMTLGHLNVIYVPPNSDNPGPHHIAEPCVLIGTAKVRAVLYGRLFRKAFSTVSAVSNFSVLIP
jgi:hypothetical protein